MYIVIAILLFGILIAVHEFGHFITAKACGVQVNEFSIGMGPLLLHKQKGETLYSWRLLPIGGFCAMEGEDESSENPRAFGNRNFFQKLLILCAGSAMNYLMGVVLLVIVFASASGFSTTQIHSFLEGCPYESSEGLQAGDRFVSIDGHKIRFAGDVSEWLGDGSKKQTHDIVVKRDGEKVTLQDFNMVPVEYEGRGLQYGILFQTAKATPASILSYSVRWSAEFVRMVWDGLRQLVSGAVGLKDMSGPVGIVSVMTEVGESSETHSDAVKNILYFCAFIAVNLAVMNMLPIPALDGGRIFLMLVTALFTLLFRRKPDPKYENYINAVGMVLLLGLMAVVMFNDITKLIIQ